MEGSLGVNNDYTLSSVCNVLILVLMEDTLGDSQTGACIRWCGLNPCSNGRYSQSIDSQPTGISDSVLILVLMEDTLRGDYYKKNNYTDGLNPCSNGRYSQRRK